MKLAYRLKAVTAVTGLSRATLYRAIADGKLVARKRGTATLILAEDLAAFIDGREVSERNP